MGAFFANGGGEEFIHLAYSWEPPERNYEGAKLIAQAIKDARRSGLCAITHPHPTLSLTEGEGSSDSSPPKGERVG